MSVVFAEEDEHGLIEHMYIAERRLLRRLTLVMDDVVGQIPVLPTAFQQAVRQIDILAIHKEILVQQPNLVERLMAQQTVCSADDLYLCGLVPRQVTHVIPFGEPQHL